jgi:hypothetical protein
MEQMSLNAISGDLRNKTKRLEDENRQHVRIDFLLYCRYFFKNYLSHDLFYDLILISLESKLKSIYYLNVCFFTNVLTPCVFIDSTITCFHLIRSEL